MFRDKTISSVCRGHFVSIDMRSAAMEVAGYEESVFLLSAPLATSESNTGKAADEWYPLVSLKTQQVVFTPSKVWKCCH